jgi:hypothetical protein
MSIASGPSAISMPGAALAKKTLRQINFYEPQIAYWNVKRAEVRLSSA